MRGLGRRRWKRSRRRVLLRRVLALALAMALGFQGHPRGSMGASAWMRSGSERLEAPIPSTKPTARDRL